jgi:hypothetical protein
MLVTCLLVNRNVTARPLGTLVLVVAQAFRGPEQQEQSESLEGLLSNFAMAWWGCKCAPVCMLRDVGSQRIGTKKCYWRSGRHWSAHSGNSRTSFFRL